MPDKSKESSTKEQAMTLALDKLPTPVCDANERYIGIGTGVNIEVARSLEQRLAMAVTFVEHKYMCNEKAYGGPCNCGLDAFLALLREKP